MVVAVLACAVGLAVVVWSLYRDDPLPPPTGRRTPDWGPLPEPADLLRLDLPRSLPGYDPASVDAHLDALVVAYRDLLAEAPPEVVARARRRAAARRGLLGDDGGDPVASVGAPHPPDRPDAVDADAPGTADAPGRPSADAADPLADDPGEALRAEAALAALRAAQQRRR